MINFRCYFIGLSSIFKMPSYLKSLLKMLLQEEKDLNRMMALPRSLLSVSITNTRSGYQIIFFEYT
jgi:hypothetical protein